MLLLYALNLQARKLAGTKAGTAPKRQADPGPSIEYINSAWEFVELKSRIPQIAERAVAPPAPEAEPMADMRNHITAQSMPDLLAPARLLAEFDALLLRRKQADEDALILILLEA